MLDSVMSGRASGTRCHLNIAVKGATTFWVHNIVALMLLLTVAVSISPQIHSPVDRSQDEEKPF